MLPHHDNPPRIDARYTQGAQFGGGNVMVNQFMAAVPATAWPVYIGRCPLQADAFQERPAIQSALSAADATAGAAVTRVLVGDGGTGKTQLAAALFDRIRRNGVDLAVWVAATSRASVLAAYAEAFVATHPGAGTGEVERDAHRFLAWLAATERSWIMVLDDVADPTKLSGLWPAGRTGQLVLTTRRREAAILARGAVVEVGVFTPQESAAFLTAKLSSATLPPDALGEAAELGADLGHLPLALAQAAAVIVNDAVTAAEYRAMLADRTSRLADLFPADPLDSGDEYEHALAGTWSLATERADMLAPAGLARPLLSLLAVLDPNGVPEAVLNSAAASAWVTSRPAGSPATATDTRRALRNLHRLSLISHDPTDAVRSVRMHALAQRATADNLPASRLPGLVRAAADALMGAWPPDKRDAAIGQVLRANTSALRSRYAAELWSSGLHPVVARAGQSLGDSGLAADALMYFDGLVADAQRVLGPDHPDTLSARYELGYWQGECGDFAGAAEAQERLLTDRVRALGPDHPATLSTRANVAFWRGYAGDPSRALAETEQVLADQVRVLGANHLDTLRTRHNCAHWRGTAGDPGAAATENQRLLADALRVLGPDDPDTLDTQRNLAYWRGRAGDAAGAAAALEGVVDAYTRLLGADHPDTLHARDDLAEWRGRAGSPARAAADFERLLADRLRILDLDHPNTLITRHNLAEWQGHAGDLTGAVATYQRLLGDQTRILGRDHLYSLSTRCNLASWRGEAEGAATAAGLLQELVADAARVLPPDHPQLLVIRHNDAYWQGRSGDPAAATAALRDLVADCIRVLGPRNPDTLNTRHNLAYWQARAGDPVGAANEFTNLLADQISVSGPDHPDVLETRHELATLRQLNGESADAARAFTELHADQQRVLGPEHPRTLLTRAHLAELDGHTKGADEAVHAYRQLLVDATRVLGVEHPDTNRIRAALDQWLDGSAHITEER
ncbi:tetratricopeptide repeat protein [Rugosimonospora africana]|uniref:Tetratricopeptide repeat protein n=1 Tax=Rugosimonospora africana TaxID=556532 RepID=A0A8J3QRW2_9ACTN|nr:tetratricopeptide repeat protein [Rugosimonospora africana]GIH15514.1 tetratricopeptide repeat protein [Rugosimonospora africana]